MREPFETQTLLLCRSGCVSGVRAARKKRLGTELLENRQRGIFRVSQRPPRNNESLLKGVLAGLHGMRDDVCENQPGRTGRKLESMFRAVRLKTGVVLQVVVKAKHEAVVRRARNDRQAERVQQARGLVQDLASSG